VETVLEIGKLHHSEDGQTVACHLCAKEFAHLGNHVRRTHGITADQYKEICELKATTGLISQKLAARRADDLQKNPSMNDREAARAYLRGLTRAERRQHQAMQRNSLEKQNGVPLAVSRRLATQAQRKKTHYRICAYCAVAFAVDRPCRERKFCSMKCYGDATSGQDKNSLLAHREQKAEEHMKRLQSLCRVCERPIGDRLTETLPTRYVYLNLQVCSKQCHDAAYPVEYARKENGQYDGMRKLYASQHSKSGR